MLSFAPFKRGLRLLFGADPPDHLAARFVVPQLTLGAPSGHLSRTAYATLKRSLQTSSTAVLEFPCPVLVTALSFTISPGSANIDPQDLLVSIERDRQFILTTTKAGLMLRGNAASAVPVDGFADLILLQQSGTGYSTGFPRGLALTSPRPSLRIRVRSKFGSEFQSGFATPVIDIGFTAVAKPLDCGRM